MPKRTRRPGIRTSNWRNIAGLSTMKICLCPQYPPSTPKLIFFFFLCFILTDNAEAYKEDGNKNFKLKKYRLAIDNYTEGIKCKSRNKELNAVLYCNRAAAQFWLGKVLSDPPSLSLPFSLPNSSLPSLPLPSPSWRNITGRYIIQKETNKVLNAVIVPEFFSQTNKELNAVLYYNQTAAQFVSSLYLSPLQIELNPVLYCIVTGLQHSFAWWDFSAISPLFPIISFNLPCLYTRDSIKF